MRIAHFSDLHLCAEFGGRAQAQAVLDAITDAVNRDAEHFVFTGDMVEFANLGHFEPILKGLKELGFTSSDHVTIVPGNHDVVPLSKYALNFSFATVNSARKKCWSLCRRYSHDSFRAWPNMDIPFVKMVANHVLIVGVDSNEYTQALECRPASGLVTTATMDRIEKVLEREKYARVKRKILAIHHPPMLLPPYNGSDFLDWQLTNRDEVRDFCKRVGFDVILSGHWHNSGSKSLKHRVGDGRIVLSGSNMSRTKCEVVYTLIDLPARGGIRTRRYCLKRKLYDAA